GHDLFALLDKRGDGEHIDSDVELVSMALLVQESASEFIRSLSGRGHYSGQVKPDIAEVALAEMLDRHGMKVLQEELDLVVSRERRFRVRVGGAQMVASLGVDSLDPGWSPCREGSCVP
ncbi:MAG: hypothetical protein Q9M13_01260, partial [Mariprofundales bacterium]|nr:hypothetical protein [Mariprofundales bacterium]